MVCFEPELVCLPDFSLGGFLRSCLHFGVKRTSWVLLRIDDNDPSRRWARLANGYNAENDIDFSDPVGQILRR